MSKSKLQIKYEKSLYKYFLTIIVAAVLLIILFFISVNVGSKTINNDTVINSIVNFFKGITNADQQARRAEKVILLLRMPRTVLAILAGLGLSVSGTVMQSITRNPLVSPFTIGLSSSAAFGASIAIVLGIGFMPHTPLGIVLNAFILSLLCAFVVYAISNKIGMTPESLILVGIAFSYIFSALTATVQFIADENQLSQAVQWTFGTLNGATWQQVLVLLAMIAIAFPVLIKNAFLLNGLSSSGDDFIKGIGIDPNKLRIKVGLVTVLMTATVISFTGVIGFVGLVSPHIARLIIGNDHRFLLPVSALFGAILVTLSDIIGRTLISPVTIPVGIIISYIGVPMFIYLIIIRRKEYF